ncbi:DUF3095 domain-containing protein [Acuticoccus kandeliae]|uniref:DUF3095 domain-containing protein n=1 Tax=Acuticoccus kandeliae TaxID=2073160 RepID=UPI000D3EA392|nr:DUF3095 domain-containing protein [Acuticoccus kandeliae]
MGGRLEAFDTFRNFADVTHSDIYRPLPDGWVLGVTDVVRSTDEIARGRQKAVNIAGAAAISGLMNRLATRDFPFTFGGDGCAFAVPAEDAAALGETLSATAAWVRDALGMTLRAALTPVETVRAAGHDVRIAIFRPTPHVGYAVFAGGGLAWVEARMKAGDFAVPAGPPGARPDLEGLSCRWRPIGAENGRMLSLVVQPGGAGEPAFIAALDTLFALIDAAPDAHPVPTDGPSLAMLSPSALRLEARAAGGGPLRVVRTAAHALMGWFLFATGMRVGSFDPAAYRALLRLNADYRKYGDALQLTLDADATLETALRDHLKAAEADEALHYGLFSQDAALMTCIVPAYTDSRHFHFIDGSGGGYTAAMNDLRAKHGRH